MKKLAIVSFLAILGLMVLAPPAGAQEMRPDNRYNGYPGSLIEWPKAPPDMKACQALEYYEPLDTHLTKYVIRVKVAGVRVQEFDECVWMNTRNRWRWVLRPKGTKVLIDARGRDLFDHGSPLGRVCDNGRPFSFVIEPEKEVPLAAVVSVPEVVPKVVVPPAPPQRVVPPVAVVEEAGTQWGLTASAMFGSFRSIPIGGLVDSIAGRQVCVEGRDFDIGFAHRGPRSLWRLTFAGKIFDEGSFTEYICTDCNQDVKTVAASGVRVWGVRGEYVFSLTSKDHWLVQPMITASLGIGHVSGSANQYTGPVGGPVTSVQNVGARELFGTSWFPFAGVGAGVMGNLGRHFTYGITVAGIEYPGVYYGRLQLTYWPH